MCDLIINYYWLIEQLLLLRTTQPESPYPLYSRPGLLYLPTAEWVSCSWVMAGCKPRWNTCSHLSIKLTEPDDRDQRVTTK